MSELGMEKQQIYIDYSEKMEKETELNRLKNLRKKYEK